MIFGSNNFASDLFAYPDQTDDDREAWQIVCGNKSTWTEIVIKQVGVKECKDAN